MRLHHANWQTITRYRAADAILCGLRNLLSANGLSSVIADSDLRAAADRMAWQAHIARIKAWDGRDPVTAVEWCKASLGLYDITEER